MDPIFQPANGGSANAPADVVIVGAGAAGLATAIFTARRNPALKILLLDGAKKIGAKILVSGGGRCNVTNTVITPDDYRGGSRNVIRRVLNIFPAEQTIVFFREIGVALHEEPNGKLFPDSNKARTVLDALINETMRHGAKILSDHRVTQIERRTDGFVITIGAPMGTGEGGNVGTEGKQQPPIRLLARNLVLATGGLSLPKTGSDGAGYGFARQLGHSIISTTPALAPLVLEGDFHTPLSGISHEVDLLARVESWKPIRFHGSMLWTHFGVSGPVAMNMSGVWERARLEKRAVSITANLLPGETFETAERNFMALTAQQPKTALRNALSALLPARIATSILHYLGIQEIAPLTQVARETRRKLLLALLDWSLPVRASRGYAYAEVTSGGVPLDEIDPATLQSRRCPGLYFVGEILDVDGRIGGFNFQWAWASGKTVGEAIGRNGE